MIARKECRMPFLQDFFEIFAARRQADLLFRDNVLKSGTCIPRYETLDENIRDNARFRFLDGIVGT